MHFHDDALFPEVQEKQVITVAPYGPEWELDDFREDLPLTMEQHVQQAVDCYEAGATVLHIHVREEDGHGSKRLSKFNELLSGLREAVPDMILQVGGSISFAPEGDGADAKWLSDDTRHMLAELDPKPGLLERLAQEAEAGSDQREGDEPRCDEAPPAGELHPLAGEPEELWRVVRTDASGAFALAMPSMLWCSASQ